ncbi:hypothetical protein N7454_002011 [Penicillium verhagenii]|nr:hypothetical protein N7454_002011 [Penicillium verhagenii]
MSLPLKHPPPLSKHKPPRNKSAHPRDRIDTGRRGICKGTYRYEDRDADLALVPILRSGLGMVEALNALLPAAVPIYHLGLFREKITLQPVEYYNNLPFHRSELSPQSPALLDPAAATTNTASATLAVLLDPIIATGATAEAAIQLLREWGCRGVLASEEGVRRAAGTWEGVEVWVGGVDGVVNEKGMIVPGVGDIGDRLFVAIGK